jgi:hypothetical protein
MRALLKRDRLLCSWRADARYLISSRVQIVDLPAQKNE